MRRQQAQPDIEQRQATWADRLVAHGGAPGVAPATIAGVGRRSVVAWAVAAALVLVGLLLAAAPLVGLQRAPGIAAALPARSALTVAAAAGLLLAAAACLRRGLQPVAVPLAVGLAVVVALHAPVVLARGVHDEPVAAPAAGQLRVLEWNTNGPLVEPGVIARLAAAQAADVVVLPQGGVPDLTPDPVTTMLSGYRRAFADAGLPVVLLYGPTADPQVLVALSPQLAAHYRAEAGPDPHKTLALRPDTSALPTILALHSPWPVGERLAGWRADLEWVARECSAGGPGAKVLVAGDLNASVDDFPGPALGGCRDAASARRSASVGTWRTELPALLAMPIDHVLSSPAVGQVVSFSVLRSEDASGARHRPTMTVIAPG